MAFLLVLGLTLMFVDLLTDGSAYSGFRSGAAALVTPLQAGATEALDDQQADSALVAENERLRAELAAAGGDQTRLAELEDVLGLVGRSGQAVVAASIVAEDARAGPPTAVVIDRGTADSVTQDQAVLGGGGLIGRVRTATAHSAVVDLITSPDFVAGARLVPSGEAGILRGGGASGTLSLQVFNPNAAITQGDTVVTFGSPGNSPFPPGLAIGTVSEVGQPAGPLRTLPVTPTAAVTKTTVVAVVIPAAQPNPAPTVGAPPTAMQPEPTAGAAPVGADAAVPPSTPSPAAGAGAGEGPAVAP